MGPEIAQKLMTEAMQPGASPSGKEGAAGGGAEKAAEFQKHLNGANNDPNAANQVGAVQQNQQANAIDQTHGTRKVHGAEIPDQQDLFGHFDHVRKEFDNFLQKNSELDKMVSEGKLKPSDPKVVQARREEMRMLLHFQNEMQGTAVKVEIASKVVEHATSGIKTVLSTQA
jgi:hypothetical protein